MHATTACYKFLKFTEGFQDRVVTFKNYCALFGGHGSGKPSSTRVAFWKTETQDIIRSVGKTAQRQRERERETEREREKYEDIRKPHADRSLDEASAVCVQEAGDQQDDGQVPAAKAMKWCGV